MVESHSLKLQIELGDIFNFYNIFFFINDMEWGNSVYIAIQWFDSSDTDWAAAGKVHNPICPKHEICFVLRALKLTRRSL